MPDYRAATGLAASSDLPKEFRELREMMSESASDTVFRFNGLRWEASMSDIQLSLTHEQLGSLCSALNEVLESVEDWEFETRLGRSRKEIEDLLRKLNDVANRRD